MWVISKVADNPTFTLIHVIWDLTYELELTLTSNALFLTSTSLMCSTENNVFNYFTNNEKTTSKANLGVGKFQWAPIVSSVNDVLLAEVLSSSGLLGTDTFPVLEGNGDDRCPPYGVGWSCVLQVLPARPEQGGYPEHDGAVRIDRQVCHAANKWKVLCTLSTKDAT